MTGSTKYICSCCGKEHEDWPALGYISPTNYDALSEDDKQNIGKLSFQDYSDNYNNENHETKYFGWLSNNLPDYDFTGSIPTTVFTRTGNSRRKLFHLKTLIIHL